MRNLTLTLALLAVTGPAMAHFGMVLPSDPIVTQEDGREVELTFGFGHPFTPEGLAMEAPQQVIVVHGDENEEITENLIAADFHGAPGFTATYTLERPGAYIVAMAPEPYFEEAEDSFIKHYTKGFISAFDDTSGWDAELGLETEIVPLTSPFGLWAGNVFKGVVLRRSGGGIRETFTVRKESYGVGVERTFPVHSPNIDHLEVVTRGDVRRAKLYYLRELRGKKAKIKEKR